MHSEQRRFCYTKFCSGPKEYVLFLASYTLYKGLINAKEKKKKKKEKEKLTLPLTDIYWHKVSQKTRKH